MHEEIIGSNARQGKLRRLLQAKVMNLHRLRRRLRIIDVDKFANAPPDPMVMAGLTSMGSAHEIIDNPIGLIGQACAQTNSIGTRFVREQEVIIDKI